MCRSGFYRFGDPHVARPPRDDKKKIPVLNKNLSWRSTRFVRDDRIFRPNADALYQFFEFFVQRDDDTYIFFGIMHKDMASALVIDDEPYPIEGLDDLPPG